MSMVQEKMYMDVDDVCAILGVSKAYAYNLMREYNKELKAKGYIVVMIKMTELQHGLASIKLIIKSIVLI